MKSYPIKSVFAGISLVILAFDSNWAAAQQAGGTNYVSQQEYERLKADHDRLQQEMNVLKAQMQQLLGNRSTNASAATPAAVEEITKKVAAQQAENDEAMSDLEKQLKQVKQMAKDSFPGTSRMTIGGYGSGTFMASSKGYGPSQPIAETPAVPRGGRSDFTATFNPIMLWKLSDRLLFEGEMELELQSADPTTSVALEMAQASYVLNDYMTFGVGKFLNPMDYFVERQHMAWVNKTPDKPLAVYDGLVPEALVGAQLRGAIPAGPTKFGYAVFVADAPALITTAADPAHPVEVGSLNYEDFDNTFNHISTGGRIGFYPIPELELGYGAQTAGVGPLGSDVNALMQSADLTYVREFESLKGTVNFHAQWIWSHIDSFAYDTGIFSNNRNGGYVQLAYRPTRIENSFLKDLEPVVRFDRLNQKNTPVGFDEDRWTFGLNYWINPSTVVKAAYEHDHQNGLGQSGDAVLLQFAIGF